MSRDFSFIVDNLLAGMARPGVEYTLREDLEFLKDQGIGGIVSLTETPLQQALIEEFAFGYLHLPVMDFYPPSLEQIRDFIDFLEQAEEDRKAVVVHCAAGLGRTGTMLACALVRRGLSAHLAIQQVRSARPGSIETFEQEDAIRQFELLMRQDLDDKEGQ